MIIAQFGLFEVQVEGVFGQSFELCELYLGNAPKALDTVDVDAQVVADHTITFCECRRTLRFNPMAKSVAVHGNRGLRVVDLHRSQGRRPASHAAKSTPNAQLLIAKCASAVLSRLLTYRPRARSQNTHADRVNTLAPSQNPTA